MYFVSIAVVKMACDASNSAQNVWKLSQNSMLVSLNFASYPQKYATWKIKTEQGD